MLPDSPSAARSSPGPRRELTLFDSTCIIVGIIIVGILIVALKKVG